MSSSKKTSFKVPQSFLDSIERARCENEERQQKQAAKEKAADLNYKREQHKIKKKRIQEGLPNARKIFAWSNEFCRDPNGHMLLKLGKKKGYTDGVFFFDAKLPGQAWRGLGVSEDGLWWIRTGCCASEHHVNNAEELAGEIEPEILEAAWLSIEDGTVWDCIRSRLV